MGLSEVPSPDPVSTLRIGRPAPWLTSLPEVFNATQAWLYQKEEGLR